MVKFWTNTSGTTYNWPNLEPMQVALYLAGEITQVRDAIPWVRCPSGNVLCEVFPIETKEDWKLPLSVWGLWKSLNPHWSLYQLSTQPFLSSPLLLLLSFDFLWLIWRGFAQESEPILGNPFSVRLSHHQEGGVCALSLYLCSKHDKQLIFYIKVSMQKGWIR